MRLGILAYSTNTGLGIQTYNLFKYLKPDKVMLVDLSPLNGAEQHPERYMHKKSFIQEVTGIPKNGDIDTFLDGLDCVFVCETPLNYYLFEKAREMGVRTVLQPNWEFLDYNNRPSLPKPDLLALPSPWHFGDYPQDIEKTILNVPVDKETLPQKKISKYRNFLHIAGRPAVHDRNGTKDTIYAFHNIPYEDCTLTVKIQDKEKAEQLRESCKEDPRIIIDDTDIDNYRDLYKGYDCLIMPRKYGGLCLPMQESLACGMPVIMTDTSPNNEVLPLDWLVACDKVDSFMTRSMIDIYQVNGGVLWCRIAEFYEMSRKVAREQNEIAQEIGDYLSWDNQLPRYKKVLGDLCKVNI